MLHKRQVRGTLPIPVAGLAYGHKLPQRSLSPSLSLALFQTVAQQVEGRKQNQARRGEQTTDFADFLNPFRTARSAEEIGANGMLGKDGWQGHRGGCDESIGDGLTAGRLEASALQETKGFGMWQSVRALMTAMITAVAPAVTHG